MILQIIIFFIGSAEPSSSSGLNVLSLLNMFGSQSSSNLVSSLLPLAGNLPIGQLFGNLSPQNSLGLITALPQIMSLYQYFIDFKLPNMQVIFQIIFFIMVIFNFSMDFIIK